VREMGLEGSSPHMFFEEPVAEPARRAQKATVDTDG
jgi:hypothetical protein